MNPNNGPGNCNPPEAWTPATLAASERLHWIMRERYLVERAETLDRIARGRTTEP